MSAPVQELQAKPNQDAIDTLERMLVMAKTGELRGVVAVTFHVGGSKRWQSGYWGAAEALWAFEHMKHSLLFDP